MKYIFEDDTEERNRKDRLRKPYRAKRKQMQPTLNVELPDGYPKNGTAQEKADYLRYLNRNNLPKWMK